MDKLAGLELHRFRINEISGEKLRILQSLLKDIKGDYPAIVGMTVFGSQVTGKATSESDVDGYLFIDEDRLGIKTPDDHATLLPGEAEQAAEYVEQNILAGLRPKFRRDLDLQYGDEFQIRPRILSKRRIDRELDDLIRFGREELEYKGYPMEFPKAPKGLNLNILFHMQLGSGLDPYRSYILKRLGAEGPAGDVAWKFVIMSVEQMERYQKVTRNPAQYPQIVTNAMQKYHLEKTPPAYSLSKKIR